MLLGWLGHCHLLLDQPEQALVVLRECAMRAPGWRPLATWQQMHGYRDVRRASIIARSLVRIGLPNG
jgi:hypothetical protein